MTAAANLTEERALEIVGCAAMLEDGTWRVYEGGIAAIVERMRETLDKLSPVADEEREELRAALDELRCCVNERAAAHVIEPVPREAFIGSGGLWSAMHRADELLERDMASSFVVVPVAAADAAAMRYRLVESEAESECRPVFAAKMREYAEAWERAARRERGEWPT